MLVKNVSEANDEEQKNGKERGEKEKKIFAQPCVSSGEDERFKRKECAAHCLICMRLIAGANI